MRKRRRRFSDIIDIKNIQSEGNNDNDNKEMTLKDYFIIVISVFGALFLIITLFKGFYVVSEQENAIVTTLDKVTRVDTSGPHFKIPWIQKVQKVDITTHGTGIGYTIDKHGQNIEDSENGIMITSDFNLLNIDFYMEYKVSDPVAYIYNSDNPEEVLTNIALSSIRSVVADYTVDEAMTTGKSQIQADVKADMLRELEAYNIGLTVLNITVQDSEPPTKDVDNAFKAVETAKQQAETDKNDALAYKNKKIPEAEATADKTIQAANATKEARIAEAEGQVARFNSIYEQYKLYPLITKKRMFYETMEDVLPSLKVYITDGSTETLLPLDSFSSVTNATRN